MGLLVVIRTKRLPGFGKSSIVATCYNAVMDGAIRIHPRDNVAVLSRASAAIQAGHKVALSAIPAGASVIKYGWPIGRATRDISTGDWVHTHNCASRLSGVTELAYDPALSPIPAPCPAP